MMAMILPETYQKLEYRKQKKIGLFLKKKKLFLMKFFSPALRTKRTLDIISLFF